MVRHLRTSPLLLASLRCVSPSSVSTKSSSSRFFTPEDVMKKKSTPTMGTIDPLLCRWGTPRPRPRLHHSHQSLNGMWSRSCSSTSAAEGSLGFLATRSGSTSFSSLMTISSSPSCADSPSSKGAMISPQTAVRDWSVQLALSCLGLTGLLLLAVVGLTTGFDPAE